MAEDTDDLAANVRQQLGDTGSLRESDLAGPAAPAHTDEEDPDRKELASPFSDPLNKAEREYTYGGESLLAASGDKQFSARMAEERKDLEPHHKEAFRRCLLNNERYEETVTLLGDIPVTFRSRTQAETDACVLLLFNRRSRGEIVSALQQTSLMRLMMLATQVAQFQGTKYDPIAEPLVARAEAPGEAPPDPEWTDRLDMWAALPEAVTTTLHASLRKFENRYWAMIDGAADVDFWQSETSS